jgi:abortive infection bacteriophage resistance protein
MHIKGAFLFAQIRRLLGKANCMRAPYPKTWLSVSDQLKKLMDRGLVIADPVSATDFLTHINYYRFTGYGLAFEQPRHTYQPGTTFEQVREAYEFDRALRDLFTESLELIELDLRTVVAYTFGATYGPFGHTLPTHFYRKTEHPDWLTKLRGEAKRSRELFIDHYKVTYQEYPDLPIWVATEVMSFGALSRMLQAMTKTDQKKIAARYRLQPLTLASCVHHLVYVRNLCAHHSRLWDRIWAIKPDLPAGKLWSPPILPDNTQLFASLLLQSTLLRQILAEQEFAQDWRQRIQELIDTHSPSCPASLSKMGLPENWNQHPLW